MSISDVTSARAAIVSSLLRPVGQQVRTYGAAPKSSSPDSGPAFLLGGRSAGVSPEIYDATGQLLNAVTGSAPATDASIPSDAAREKRAKALEPGATSVLTGDLQAGRARLEEVLAEDPEDVTALRFIGQSYMAEGDYVRAEQFYARASSLNPANAQSRDDLADARALQQGDDEVLADVRRRSSDAAHRGESLRLLSRLAERSPRNADVQLALADELGAAGQAEQAGGVLEQALIHADERQITEVIRQARQLAKEQPRTGSAHNILGRALAEAGRYDEAVLELNIATSLAPNERAFSRDLAGAYVSRARSAFAAGDAEAADSDVRMAQGIDRDAAGLDELSAGVIAIRAERDVSRGHYNKALARMRSVASNPPDDPEVGKKLAAVYVRVGVHFKNQSSNTQALANYERAYALDPNSASVRRNVGELSHSNGLAALDALEYDEAVRLLERSYGTYRPDATYGQDLAKAYDARGQWLIARDKLDDAIEDYERGLAVDPTNTTLGTHYAQALALKNG